MTLQGAETWIVRKVGKKYLESFEMWCWKREKISWTDRVKNEVLQKVKKERNIVRTIRQRKAKWICHIFRGNCFLKHVIAGKIRGTIRRGRMCKQVLYCLKEKRRYWNLKVENSLWKRLWTYRKTLRRE
jgi:hypothetical protein